MSEPRDATPYEASQYRQAIEKKDATKLQDIVCNLYPNVMWGSITRTLSEADRAWAMTNMRQQVEEEFD